PPASTSRPTPRRCSAGGPADVGMSQPSPYHYHKGDQSRFSQETRIVDEQQRGRLADDLKGFFKGELHFDELSRALYSTDASIFQVQPLGVAVPRDEEDVQALVRYAAEHQLPLVPRGAGTGVAGEALGAG